MSWNRARRLEAIIQEKVATIVHERLGDPRLGFLTITRVELSHDRRLARVFYTVLGEEGQRRTTQRALESAAPHIQERIAPTLQVRLVPELRFAFDERVERESRMRALLDDLAAERGEQPGSEGAGDDGGDDDGGRDDGSGRDAGDAASDRDGAEDEGPSRGRGDTP